MSDYSAILTAAMQLPVSERVRLIEEIEETLVEGEGDELPPLSAEWLAEIDRRSAEIDAGTAKLEDWETVRARVFGHLNLSNED